MITSTLIVNQQSACVHFDVNNAVYTTFQIIN